MAVTLGLRGELLHDIAAVEALRDPWDELAVACGRPFCSPAWMLSWLRHAAPPDATLRVGVVREGDELVAIAPFFARRGRGGLGTYRPLAAGSASPLEPLARPGTEASAAAKIASMLSEASPRPHVISLEGVPSASPWPRLLVEAWPGRRRPWLHAGRPMPSPGLDLRAHTYEDWLAMRARSFRKELHRRRRRLDSRGARFHLAATRDEAEQTLKRLAELHYARWETRGGSRALTPELEAMLLDVAAELLPGDRFRLCSLELDGEIVATELLMQAGGVVAAWLGGFDPAAATYAPTIQLHHQALMHAWKRSEAVFSFGPGGQEHKSRFADGDEMVAWYDILPRTARYPLTRLQLAPRHVRQGALRFRHAVSRRVSERTRARVRRLLAKVRVR